MTPLIDIRGLGKRYRIYANPSQHLKTLLWPGSTGRFTEIWALRDVSFSVCAGEVVGIVGRNGSGKSTLLQLVAGTLTPTQGRVDVQGRVAALLELGSGFNADFTGRENVFLNGLLLGASREEIKQRLTDIEAFAEIGAYFDQPVKTYSSGMVVRLAFAVQSLLDKDILIVDEALAVGDEVFQRKCFAVIERFRESGGTVLFVSHSGETIVQLCDRALLLHHGQMVLQGNAKRVMDWYHKLIYSPPEAESEILERMRQTHGVGPEQDPIESQGKELKAADSNHELITTINNADFDPNLHSRSALFYEDRGVRIVNYRILDSHGYQVNLLHPRQRYIWCYEVVFEVASRRVRFGMSIKTASGLNLGGAITARAFQGLPEIGVGQRVEVRFVFTTLLVGGIYFVNAGVVGEYDGQEHYLARGVDIGVFRLIDDGEYLISGGPVDFVIDAQMQVFDG